MTKDDIALVLERAGAWPEEARLRLICAALEIEKEYAEVYRLSGAERADLREAAAEFDRGEVASDEEVRGTFEQLRAECE